MKRIKGQAHQGMLDPDTAGAATSVEAKTELLIRNTATTSTTKYKNFICCLDMLKYFLLFFII
jgi:hypothetical protein